MHTKIACIFPAFGSDFSGKEKKILNDNLISIKEYINTASSIVNFTTNDIDQLLSGNFNDELTSQYITYIYSCVISDFLKKNRLVTNYVAGYSMGIYAALYHTGSVSFEEGLLLIARAYKLIAAHVKDKKFGMGAIIGLEYVDIISIINQNGNNTEIINVNNTNSYVLSGPLDDIYAVIDAAKEEGAINTKVLPIYSCYHSRLLDSAALQFREFVDSINVKAPECSVISNIDQREMISVDDIEKELVDNLNKKINWYQTMRKLLDCNVGTFVECGPGISLFKIGKFIEGDFKIYTVKTLKKFLDKLLLVAS